MGAGQWSLSGGLRMKEGKKGRGATCARRFGGPTATAAAPRLESARTRGRRTAPAASRRLVACAASLSAPRPTTLFPFPPRPAFSSQRRLAPLLAPCAAPVFFPPSKPAPFSADERHRSFQEGTDERRTGRQVECGKKILRKGM